MREGGLENQLQNSYMYRELKGTQIKLFLIN